MTQANTGNVQGFPIFPGMKVLEPNGSLSVVLYRFLLSLWFRQGKNFIANVNSAYLQQSPTGAGAPLEVRKSSDGSLIGIVPVVNIPGEPAVTVPVVGVSPFLWSAPKDGTLVVESGKVEIRRPGGTLGATFWQVSLVGGAVPMLSTDEIRVTWYNAPPLLTFLPIAS